MPRRAVSVLVTAALLTVGCRGGGEPAVTPIGGSGGPTADVATPSTPTNAPVVPSMSPTPTGSSAPSATPSPTDPFAVPEAIDVAYAQRVFDELFRLIGDAHRIAYEQVPDGGPAPTEALGLLRAASHDRDYYLRLAQLLERTIDSGFEGLHTPIADRRFIVRELREASDQCIVAVGEVDFRVTAINPPDPVFPYSYAIRPLTASAQSNVTGWGLSDGTGITDTFPELDPVEVCP